MSHGDATGGVASRDVSPQDRQDGVKEDLQLSGEEREGKKLAIFDFDGTLVEHDSLRLVIVAVCGNALTAYVWLAWAAVTAFLEGLFTAGAYMDMKTALKAHWIRHTLGGHAVEDVQKVADGLKDQLGWRQGLVDDMKRYAGEGREIVVATGALDVYIDTLLHGLPVKAVICTMTEVENGRMTGYLKGEKHKVNPVRDEKRIRTQAYIQQNGPYGHIVGYGNMPDDGAMLSLCDEFYVL